MAEYEADTPDTYGISFAAHPKYEDGNIPDLLSVEVTESETHSDEDVIAFVKRKLSNKYLPNHYILLGDVAKFGYLATSTERDSGIIRPIEPSSQDRRPPEFP